MKKAEVKNLAVKLMNEFGLSDWTFDFNAPSYNDGECLHAYKRISLNSTLHKRWGSEFIEDVIRHEIAHALVGDGQAHNEIWAQKAKSIGVKFTLK